MHIVIIWLHALVDMSSLTGVYSSPLSAAYMRQWIGSALVQIMACRLLSTKPLSEPMLGYCQLDPWEQIWNFGEISIKIQNFSLVKMHLKILSAKWQPFCPGGDESICYFMWYHASDLSLVHVMASHPLGNKPLPEPMISWCQLNPPGNFKQFTQLFSQEYAFENVVGKMTTILFRPQCDMYMHGSSLYLIISDHF